MNNEKIHLSLDCPFLSLPAFAQEKIETFEWNGIPVQWLSQSHFPTYDMVIYFADGALSDHTPGETDTMFSLLDSGTKRFEQRDISDYLEYYGVSHFAEVTPEYSVYHISGLVKDLKPTLKIFCHLFTDARFPDEELHRFKTIRKERLNNLPSSLGALSSRAFRAITMEGTPFAIPVEGRLKDVDHWHAKKLREKLDYMNEQVAKKIYISGPASILEAKEIVTRECGWSGRANFVREVEVSKKSFPKNIPLYLVTVPQATQAYINVGRVLAKDEIQNLELLELMSSFLGGGFSSKLMQEIRVKRGLSYGADASVSGQKNYGRLIVSTYTKNESVVETIKVIRTVLEDMMNNKVEDKDFLSAKEGLVGSYPFRFEREIAYLDQLIYFEHIGRKAEDLYRFSSELSDLKKTQLVALAKSLFDKEGLAIVVLGPKELAEKLKALGEVRVVPYGEYL